ncbi:MAG TPA: helix-turn-helix transcriptional regulator, partial [Ornithinibacter sp.]|nr:helix-turn-helix transcriptional regulator [Ornithinibacter sp.]
EVDFHTHLLISSGELVAARTALDGTGHVPQLTPCRIDLALAFGDLSTARRLLDRWRPTGDDRRSVVRRLLRAYLVLDAEGDHRQAASVLSEAVARAEDDQLRWPFLEVPAALRALRRRAPQPSVFAHDALWGHAVSLHPLLRAQAGLVEPLTERELEVLARLMGRAKNQEIAAELYVSLNTLKTHLANIYRKLGVTERNQAVARATDLGLI